MCLFDISLFAIAELMLLPYFLLLFVCLHVSVAEEIDVLQFLAELMYFVAALISSVCVCIKWHICRNLNQE